MNDMTLNLVRTAPLIYEGRASNDFARRASIASLQARIERLQRKIARNKRQHQSHSRDVAQIVRWRARILALECGANPWGDGR